MRLNKYLLSMFLSLCSLSAFATASDWSGFYVGGNVGADINTSNDQTSLSCNTNLPGGIANASYVAAFNAAGNQSLSFNNFVAGVQGGYNFQINKWVLGIESNYALATQAQGANTAFVFSTPGEYNGYGGSNITQSIYQSWDFTVRPRIGYIVNHFLIYATGGFALSKINYTSYTDWNNTDGNLSNSSTAINESLPGWAAGGGLEWRIVSNRWSLDAEYFYEGFEQFNQSTLINNNDDDPTAALNHKGSFNSNVLMVGVNYIFG